MGITRRCWPDVVASRMDRDALKRFLGSPHVTLRWAAGDAREGYEAIETTDAGLRYYRWSHLAADGGMHDESVRTWARYAEEGAGRTLPQEIDASLGAWWREHGQTMLGGT